MVLVNKIFHIESMYQLVHNLFKLCDDLLLSIFKMFFCNILCIFLVVSSTLCEGHCHYLGQIVEGSNHLITNALSFGFEILELFFKDFFFF